MSVPSKQILEPFLLSVLEFTTKHPFKYALVKFFFIDLCKSQSMEGHPLWKRRKVHPQLLPTTCVGLTCQYEHIYPKERSRLCSNVGPLLLQGHLFAHFGLSFSSSCASLSWFISVKYICEDKDIWETQETSHELLK